MLNQYLPMDKILQCRTSLTLWNDYSIIRRGSLYIEGARLACPTRVSAKRTPSGGMRICTQHILDLGSLIPNWCLKNVFDVLRLTFSSSSAETLHCEVGIWKEKKGKQFSIFLYFNANVFNPSGARRDRILWKMVNHDNKAFLISKI